VFGLFNKLEDCDPLFKKFLSPWYPEKERPVVTRPDMYVIAGYEGQPLDLDSLQYLNDQTLIETKAQIEKMIQAALADYQDIIKSDKLSINVLDAVDKYYDKKKVIDIVRQSDPKDFSNLYLVNVCEFGAMLGFIFNENEEFGWLYSYPYFHSIVVHKKTGYGITVFDWAVKKFSAYGIDDGFAAKYFAAIEAIRKQ
jgi:hypothetical protein